MTITTTHVNPGTSMPCAGLSAVGASQGSGMGWSTPGTFAPRGRANGINGVFGAIAERDSFVNAGVVAAQGYVQATIDLPTIKQFRVPLSLRERST
jgi:hypothetical protein